MAIENMWFDNKMRMRKHIYMIGLLLVYYTTILYLQLDVVYVLL